MSYADVAVNAPGAGRRSYSYSVPEELGGRLRPGHAVLAPFGRRSYQGIVISITTKPGYPRTRPIQAILEDEPVIAESLIELGRWIADRYQSSLYAGYQPMLPPAFERRQSTIVRATEEGRAALPDLSERQAEVLEFVLEAGETTTNAIRNELGVRAARDITALTNRGYVEASDVMEGPRISARFETIVHLMTPPADALAKGSELRESGALRQADALEALVQLPGSRLADLRRVSGAERRVWDALAECGLISMEEREARRDPLASRAPEPVTFNRQLTPHQADAVTQITASIDARSPHVYLLHGVTGSGKTEVYLRAFQRAMELGRKGIMLVPEIALTPQMVGRFWERFPGRVAVLHSGLSLREQFDEWRSVQEGRFDVVIGSRHAALAPMPDIGLIVVDEEQEWTYKQESPEPRYHARDVAIERARRAGVPVVLGSATPDVGTMYTALRGDHVLLELPGRITTSDDNGNGVGWSDAPLADVDIVDMRQELLEGNRGVFSRRLTEAMSAALSRGEQAILFVNRRGAGQAVQCRSCGHTMRCRRCTTVMTFHADGSIVCHLCGARRRSPTRCPRCNRATIRAIGIGTERVAAEVEAILPGTRAIRWDRDAVIEARGHEPILGAFMRREADVLVGTQMIAKGLDLPSVTIVGVVNADIGLHAPDFRASERTFQLLCQVAGRAGRGYAPGRVIMQTYEPENESIRAAAQQDYRQFYLQETQFRQRMGYPPFARMARLVCSRQSRRDVETASKQMDRTLRSEIRRRGLMGTRVIGPSPAPWERLRGRYRWQITILSENPAELLETVALPTGWTVNIDPMSAA